MLGSDENMYCRSFVEEQKRPEDPEKPDDQNVEKQRKFEAMQ